MDSDDHKSDEQQEVKTEITRREALKLAATGFLASLPIAKAFPKALPEKATAGHSHPKSSGHSNYTFLQKHESSFLEAAVKRLIPADEEWGGALEAGVVNYIDLQLGGSWGAGERLYRSGPWVSGTKGQGYQLAFTPAELFRTALRAIDKDFKSKKSSFEKMSDSDQDAYLKKLEAGDGDLDGVPEKVFFSSLYQMTIEGFFADPSYGGNRDMLSWRMIGFPGAYASYYDLVDKHGIKLNQAPMSIAQDAQGKMHMHPNTSANAPKAQEK